MRKGLLFVFLLISINIFAFDCLNWSIKIEGDSVCCLKQEKVLSVVISGLSPADSCLYIWQELKGGQYITISEFSGDSLVLENVESGTFCYRCIAKPNECVQDTSEIFKLIVRPDITAAEIVGQEDSICYNIAPQMFSVKVLPTCAEDDSFTYQWEESVDSIEWNAIDGATTDSYQPGALVADRYYRLRTTSVQGCGVKYSNVIKVCVYSDLLISTQGVEPLCYMAQDDISVSSTGQGELYTYQWYYSGNNIDFVEIEGATSATYRTESKIEGTYYYKCKVTPIKGCFAKESDVIVVEVYSDVTSGSIVGADTICYNFQPSILQQTVLPTGGDGVYRYQWQKREKGSSSWQNIPSAVNKTYQPTSLTTTTDYRLGVIDECDTVYTDSVRITVRPDITAAEIQGQIDTICYNMMPSEFSVKSYPTGGDDDRFIYQWEESVDGITYVDILGATADRYQPGALTSDKYYRLRTTSIQGCGDEHSNVIKVCVYDDLQITTQGIEPLCYMKQEEIRVSATGQGGLYTYQWQYSENNVDFVDISGATSSTYKINGKTEGKYYYKCVVTSVKCCDKKDSAVIEVEVYEDLTSGEIQGTDTICYNDDPGVLSQKVEPTGGDGVYRYQWQKREKGSDIWQDIPSAVNKTYQPTSLTTTTDYRLGVINKCKTVYTDSVRITVRPDITAAEIQGQIDTICYNKEPSEFSVKSYPTGGDDDRFTYQWEESVDGITYVDILGATADRYQPGALISDKYYRLRTTSIQGCGDEHSNVIKVCVYDDLQITTQGIEPLCYMKQEEIRVSATGQGGLYTYQWYYSGNNIDFVEIEGATSATYRTEAKTEGTYYYKCKVTPIKGCLAKESDVIVVEVYSDVTSGSIIGADTICYNTQPSVLLQTVLPTGGDGVYRYQWQKREKGSDIWQDIPSATNKTYQPISLTITTDYRLGVIDECDTVYTDSVRITVRPDITAAGIEGEEDSICYNTAPQMFSVKIAPTCAEDDSFIYQWEESEDGNQWNSIDGATTDSYQSGALVSDRYYRLRTTSVQGCGYRFSNVIKVCVYKDLEITTQGVSPLCYMASGEIGVLATGQGEKYTYQWQYSENNVDFVDILGATNSSYYTDPKKEGMYYYKCVVTSVKCCDKKESAVIEVEVYADLQPAIIGVEYQEVCYGEDAIELSIVQPAKGGGGDYIYLWQKSVDKEEWSDVELSETYLPKNMIETTYFRLQIKTDCKVDYSNIVEVKVNPLPEKQSIKGNTNVCYNQYEYYYIDELKEGFEYRWYVENSYGEIVSLDLDTDTIEILWKQSNVEDVVVLQITNRITGCIIQNKYTVNVCAEKAPDRTIIVRKPNSDILVAQESAEIYYAWGYTTKSTKENVYIEDSNRRYVLLPHTFDNETYDYWLRLQPTKESQCYSISYYSSENDEEYIHQENRVTVPTYVKEQVSLQINNADEREVKCSLYTLVGQLIFSKHFGQDSYIDYNIPLPSIRGMYILKVELGNEVLTFKLIAE